MFVVGKYISKPQKVIYSEPFEHAISNLLPEVEQILPSQYLYMSRWICIKLIDSSEDIIDSLKHYLKIDLEGNVLLQEKRKTIQQELNLNANEIKDKIVSQILFQAENICNDVCIYENENYQERDRKIDKILTSKKYGFPIMIAFLGVIFWLTITGANYPSSLLVQFFGIVEEKLVYLFTLFHAPLWLKGILIDGMYKTLAWVVSVMLPPMAIFFPLFTILEDLGYLPRIAFNLDHYFKKAGSNGKQALTMCMGVTKWNFFIL